MPCSDAASIMHSRLINLKTGLIDDDASRWQSSFLAHCGTFPKTQQTTKRYSANCVLEWNTLT